MKHSWKWFPIVALAVCMALPAAAQRLGARRGSGWGLGARQAAAAQNPPAPSALKDFLGLTDQQVRQLIDLRKQAAKDNRSIAEQIRAKRHALAGLMKQANPDPAKIGQIHLDIKKLNDQRLARLKQLRTQSQDVLTAEQKQKLADLEKALQLDPAARQAVGLGLIAPPQPPAGAGLGAGRRGAMAAPMRMARPGRLGAGWI